MIVAETLDMIATTAASFDSLDEAALAKLKTRWPELRFTLCSDDDMPARMPPMLQRERFNLYLLGEGDHCLSLTCDPLHAIGVVLATVDED